MKLLIDMNLSPRWCGLLEASGIEAVHWSSIGAATAPDSEIMIFAYDNQYIVLTQDLDFGIMLAMGKKAGPSVVQLRADDVSPKAVGTLLIRALQQMSADLEAGALLTVDPKRTRLRLLPLRPADPPESGTD